MATHTSARSATTASGTVPSRPARRPVRQHQSSSGRSTSSRSGSKRIEELHARGVPEAYLYGDEPGETYSELHSFYLLIDRPAIYGLPEAPFNPWLHLIGDYVRTIVSGLATVAAILAVLFLQGS